MTIQIIGQIIHFEESKGGYIKAVIAAVGLLTTASAYGQAQAGEPLKSLLPPGNHTLILIDHLPQMAFAAHAHGVQTIRNNITGLARSATVFNVPSTLITVASKSLSGPTIPEW